MKKILDFLKDYKELFQNKPENLDWAEIYNLASARFGRDNIGKFTDFWLNRNIHPENYLTELPGNFCRESTIKEFTIPNHIKSISENTFRSCSNLTSVTIPNTVTSIGSSTFEGCKSLTSVIIPDSVTSIGDNAFCGCSSLTSVTIGDSITFIGHDTFRACFSLTSMTIPDSVTFIGYYAFVYCSSLTNINIPDSVTYIDDDAFSNCGDKLVIDYNSTKEDWKKIYNSKAFTNTYFIVNCTDGKIIKKRR